MPRGKFDVWSKMAAVGCAVGRYIQRANMMEVCQSISYYRCTVWYNVHCRLINLNTISLDMCIERLPIFADISITVVCTYLSNEGVIHILLRFNSCNRDNRSIHFEWSIIDVIEKFRFVWICRINHKVFDWFCAVTYRFFKSLAFDYLFHKNMNVARLCVFLFILSPLFYIIWIFKWYLR